jgi:uncharacterized protein YndB with AHSA1/START domain
LSDDFLLGRAFFAAQCHVGAGGRVGAHPGDHDLPQGVVSLPVEPPTRTVETWIFDGWPGVEAVESTELHEAHGVTKLTRALAFRDKAGRDHMTKTDGLAASYDNVEDLLRSLLDPKGTVSG